jgi:hypothetical protein
MPDLGRHQSTDSSSSLVAKGRAIRAVCGRMTGHPEITGSPGEFETCPDWVPAMDSCQQFAWITLKQLTKIASKAGASTPTF